MNDQLESDPSEAPSAPKMRPLMNERRVAEVLGLTYLQLRWRRKHGTLCIPYVLIGRNAMYRPEDVEKFISEHTVRPGEQT